MTKTGHRGLCKTCRNDPVCKLPRTASRPVVQCEEFDILEPKPAAGDRRGKKNSLSSAGRRTATEAGLCCNCGVLKNCCFPGAGQGVIYCEEYR